jgi:hypothetical protein
VFAFQKNNSNRDGPTCQRVKPALTGEPVTRSRPRTLFGRSPPMIAPTLQWWYQCRSPPVSTVPRGHAALSSRMGTAGAPPPLSFLCVHASLRSALLPVARLCSPSPVLAFLRHRVICKHTYINCSLHPGVFQDIESTGKQ